MVTKAKKNTGKKKNVKVLNLKKETVRNLTGGERKRVKGADSTVYPVIKQSIVATDSGVMSGSRISSIGYSGR